MKNSLVKSVGIITIIAIISKVLGFGRDMLMAAYFGASYVTDAYNVASIIPVLLLTAIGMAIISGMAPIYAEAKSKSMIEAKNVISVLATVFLIISVAVTILFFIFTPVITKIVAPGFNPEEARLTSQLTMIMLPSFCFLVLASLTQGILEYEKNFAPPAFVAIPQNILIIIAVMFLSTKYGIYGIAVATLLGAVLQFFIQYPFIRKYNVLGFNFHFIKYQKVISSSFKLFAPIIIASVAYQVNAVVDRMVSSHLAEGSVSALNYSNKLMYLPLSIVLLSLVTVLYPGIVDAIVDKGKRLPGLIFTGINVITFIGIPITVVMLAESQTLVDFAYKRGAFDTTASIMTSKSFYFYSFGMVFVAIKEFLNRCFVALRESKVTMIVSIVTVALNVVLSIVLSRFFDVGGIALASSIAMFAQAVLLFSYLPKKIRIDTDELKNFFLSFTKLIVTSIVLYFIVNLVNDSYKELPLLLRFAVTTIISFVVYGIIAWLLKLKEMSWIISFIKSKRRSKANG
ncbi:murein biosynthesis integral membrane protein MurJ [Bacillus sp. EB600]|uniref:murein biosynthesis integral membrane protein MurJ n=1 Tax=Bacillus sp. EB600 TaxID=2806345 RepID=UPI00210E9BA5|nr:murein biosynthesis integral membrane protein MurJ [Bacillus sp. EB600]MCQ6278671.1 murein biosynthesis integral membrane protein MurJ [Bacillus sp. EB600]